jgi:20S proteasome alpha/beta subunit
MTIAAGFCASDGILICADTLYSGGSGIKLYDPKVFSVQAPAGKAIFTFSGNANFAIAAIQKCQASLLSASPKKVATRENIASLVESVISGEYRKHIFRRPDRRDTDGYQILACIWSAHDGAALYSSWETSLIQCTAGYECIGVGQHLGHYLIRQMYRPNLTLTEAAIIALSTISKAKEYVDGCGGRTSVGIITADGTLDESFSIRSDLTDILENQLTVFDASARKLLLAILGNVDEAFNKELREFVISVSGIRTILGVSEHGRNLYKQIAEIFKKPGAQPHPESTTVEKSLQPPLPESREGSGES